MKIKLLLFFLILTSFGILPSCEKEYSSENDYFPGTNSGVAIFTYSDSSGNCANAVINGTYKAGVATTESNTVNLKVSVSTIGTYAVSTETVNGIIFSGSGTFTSTGVQTIILFANGTPTIAGTYVYGLKSNGCFFSIPFSEATNNNNSAVFTFPSAPNECDQVKVNGIYIVGDSLNVSHTVIGIQVNVTNPGNYYLSTVPSNGISFTGSGTFSTIGLQTVNLSGSGAPITSGQFNYSPGNNGCYFTISVLPDSPIFTDFIKCKINGVSVTFNDSVLFKETQIPGITPVPEVTGLDISGKVSNSSSPENILISLSKVGTSIIPGEIFDQTEFTNGKLYLVSYTDANAIPWNAVPSNGITPFTITVTSKTATRVQGTFSGTLSDTAGKIRIVTEGVFSIPIE